MKETRDLSALLEQLSDFRIRSRARRELEKLGAAAAEPLVDFLRRPGVNENARWTVLELLGQLRHEPAVPVLIELLRRDAALRGKACQTLQAITGRDIGEDADAWVAALTPAQAPAAAPAAVVSGPDNAEFKLVREAVADLALEITWEEPGYAYLRLGTQGGRTQQIVITFAADPRTTERTACVYTECGPALPVADEMITRRNVTVRYGEFASEKDADGKVKVVFRTRMPVRRLTPLLLRDIVASMAQEADSFEYEMHQTDRV